MVFRKRFLAASLAAVMTVGMMTGCTTVRKSDLSDDYSEVVAATYGDENIYLDEVNYYLRNQQLIYEYYGAMYGMDFLESEDSQDSLREEVMAMIYQTRVLCSYASEYDVELTEDDEALVQEAVDELLSDEDNEAFMEIAGNDEDMLIALMQKNALANKVYNAIITETEITATEESVRMNSISYLLLTEEEETEDEDSTEEETADEEETSGEDETEVSDEETEAEAESETEEVVYYTEDDANAALEKIQAGSSIEEVGEELGLDVTETNYSVNEEQTTEDGEVAVTLEDGESAVAYVEGTGWYVMYCNTSNDEDATADAYETAVEEEQSDYFTEVYEALDKETFKVYEDVVATLDIANTPVYGIEEETEEETSEGATEDSTEEETSEEATEDSTEGETSEEATEAETTEEGTSEEAE